MEHRSHKGTIEVRDTLDGSPVITGYAAVFNRKSADMGFIEMVDPAAFNRTLGQADVRALGNHDCDWLLGRSKSGTLRLATDGTGLRYEIDVNMADPDGVRAVEKIRRGDLDGSSFTFQTIRDEWNWDTTPPQRRLLEVSLIDVGPVVFPAYPDATAAARALTPIAEKVGRSPEELVDALKTGEIRSLIETPKEKTMPAETTPEAAAVEDRAGKVLSKANADLVRAAYKALRDLMDTALDEEIAEGEYNSIRSLLELVEERHAELDAEVPVSASVTDIDVQMRMRELAMRADSLTAA